jgi:futalosine hydrolase
VTGQPSNRVPAPAARILVVTAVEAERCAVERGCRPRNQPADPDVTVAAVGVGPAAAAAATARLLALAELAGNPYGAVLCAGIAGGFAEQVAVGGLVVATACLAADLGSQDGEDFRSLDELGFGSTRAAVPAQMTSWLRARLPAAAAGTILTVSSATGSSQRAAWLRARYPDAVAEAMEGFGVATAAAGAGVAFGELRAVSNPVGPRERATWRIPQALGALEQAVATLLESSPAPGAELDP